MRVVNTTELKKGLRRHLRDVRKGEEILIMSRRVPIARIVSLAPTGKLDANTRDLTAAGLLRPGRRPTKAFWRKFWAMPAPRIPMKYLLKAISDEREED